MSRLRSLRLLALLTALAPSLAVWGADKTTPKSDPPKQPRRSVSASVEVASGKGVYIQAEKRPGEFTIPKGYQAVDLKYAFHDPKTDFATDKLRPSNIYSVTQKRYYPAVTGDPDAGLPPGEYKLVVGGQPGASGVLSYRLKPVGDDFQPIPIDKKPPPGARIVDVETWAPGKEEWKSKATYHILGGKVTGEMDHTYPAHDRPNFHADPQRVRGTFEGTIAGDVISGTWKLKHDPNKVVITGNDGKAVDRVDNYTITIQSRTVLNADGTLSESGKVSGVTEWQWGPSAPDANKHGKHEWSNSYPDKDAPAMQGVWKERKK